MAQRAMAKKPSEQIPINKKPMKMKAKRFNFTIVFLLGVIGCKWWINHGNQRIRIYLPESKRYIARFLQLHLGGTICDLRKPKSTGVMWQTANKKTILAIKKATKLYQAWLPPELLVQLDQFAKVFGLD